MTEGTKEIPAALDGYERAKPDEPIFTLQGGDELAIKAVKYYISKRREAAVRLPSGDKRDAELLRCREAEKQLFRMEEYLKNYEVIDELAERPIEPRLIELHDVLIWAAGRVSNSFSELNSIWEKLNQINYSDNDALEHINCSITDLRSLYNKLEPRRSRRIV